jgi:DnaJ family protein C protein 11
MLSPIVQLGVDPEAALSVPVQESQFNIGYISLPKSKKQQVDEEEDSDDEGLTHGNTAESWHWRVAASPEGGALTLNYARNLFSGRIDGPARSEWNVEGYQPMVTTTEHRAVRLEIETTARLDGSLGWNISGTRQVGDFTRLGLGVGVAGGRGLMVSISWRRLGQAINLPVVICPLDLVGIDIAALAVIIPWATYCGIEFGYIRPRERRKRRHAIIKRRKELKKLTAKRKAESQKAIELMAEQVHRRQERERAHGGLVIDRAEYGYYRDQEVKGEEAERNVIDMTIPVAALVDHGQLIIPRDTVKVCLSSGR